MKAALLTTKHTLGYTL